jgi:hypothetical protein
MAPHPKPEKEPLFTERYWDRQTPSERGDPNGDIIAQAVGYALSSWESADQALAHLFIQLTECTTTNTFSAIRRAYGSIESNSGRRNAVTAAAEVYFGQHWQDKLVRQPFTDIINAVQWASKRRDDVAHGVIFSSITVDDTHYGAFLLPPEYNTGRTFAYIGDSADPLRIMRAKYRYTSANIREWQSKFSELAEAILIYTASLRGEEGRFTLD